MKIFHYTSAQGLIGILNNKTLWATHYNYLNDQTEFNHAKKIILNTIEESENPLVIRYKEILIECLTQIYNIYAVYTCSFSEEKNLLSQWRAYCPFEGGFSIGFNLDELKKQSSNFFQCIYKYNEKTIEINKLIIQFCENIENLTQGKQLRFSEKWQKRFEQMKIIPYSNSSEYNTLDLEKNHIFIRYELALLAARLKDESFYEEKEFRYIIISAINSIDDVKYRYSKNLIIPYLNLNFNNESICELLIGPSINQNQNKHSINLLRESLNLNFDIECSKIPYRKW